MGPLARAIPRFGLPVAFAGLAVGVVLSRVVFRMARRLIVLATLVVLAVRATTAVLGGPPL